MPNTKINWASLKNHWQYGKWIYAAIAVGVYFLGSMVFTMTEYRPPNDRKVEFQLVGMMLDPGPADKIAQSLLPAAQEKDPTLEAIGAYNIMYSGDAQTDMAGAQKFMVMLSAQEGAVYVLNRELMQQLVEQGVAMPLDPYIQSGTINADGLDLTDVTLPEPPLSEEEPASGEKYIYALPCANLERFKQMDIGLDVSDKYMMLMAYCPNPDTAAYVMQAFRDAMK